MLIDRDVRSRHALRRAQDLAVRPAQVRGAVRLRRPPRRRVHDVARPEGPAREGPVQTRPAATATWTWFDSGNNKEREGSYDDGKKDGAWNEWSENKPTFNGTYATAARRHVHVVRSQRQRARPASTSRTAPACGRRSIRTTTSRRRRSTCSTASATASYQELTPRKARRRRGPLRRRRQARLVEGVDRHRACSTLEEHVEARQARRRGGRSTPTARSPWRRRTRTARSTARTPSFATASRRSTGQFAADRKTGRGRPTTAAARVMLTASYKDGVLDGPWHELVDGAVLRRRRWPRGAAPGRGRGRIAEATSTSRSTDAEVRSTAGRNEEIPELQFRGATSGRLARSIQGVPAVNRDAKTQSALIALARSRRMQRAMAHAYLHRNDADADPARVARLRDRYDVRRR